jgi:hypothetical protein
MEKIWSFNESVTSLKTASPYVNNTLLTNDVITNKLTTDVPTNVSQFNPVNSTFPVSSSNGLGNDSSLVVYLNSWLYVMYIIIGVVGVVGNGVVALVMIRYTNMRRRLTNIYVINQSLIDLMTSLWLLLLTVFQDPYLPPGIAGELKCRIWLSKVRENRQITCTFEA